MFSFISDDSIERLRSHKFKSAGSTYLDVFMDPFWAGTAELIPRWVSPNLVSVFGGSCNVAASFFSILATRVRSPPLYFVAPALIFIYMTADAVDGKHARRTQQSTPLGAIVDHGIDAFCAFTTGFAVVNTIDPTLSSVRIMLGYCMFHLSWFCAQWGELNLGALDQRGITEGEFATMFVFALPGIVDLDFFTWRVYGTITVQLIMEIAVSLGCGAVAIVFLVKILTAKPGNRLSACLPFLHMCLHSAVAVLLAGTPFGQQNTMLDFLVVGMNAALLMTKVRLAATLHCNWPLVHLDMLPFLLVAGIEIAGVHLPATVFYALLLWQLISYTLLWSDTVGRICRVLDIPFIAPVPEKKVPPTTFAAAATPAAPAGGAQPRRPRASSPVPTKSK